MYESRASGTSSSTWKYDGNIQNLSLSSLPGATATALPKQKYTPKSTVLPLFPYSASISFLYDMAGEEVDASDRQLCLSFERVVYQYRFPDKH